MNAPQHICLVRLSALGDICLTVPVVRTLQRTWPGSRLTWVIGRAGHALVEGLAGVEFVVLDKSLGVRGYFRAWQALRRRQFDALLAMQASFRAHWLYPAIRAPLKVGFDHSRARDLHWLFVNRRIQARREHLLDSFLQFAEVLGATDRIIEWNLPISNSDLGFAHHALQSPGPWLAMNPAASKPERTWPAERYASTCTAAMARWNCRIVLTGGPDASEKELARAIQAKVRQPDRIVDLVGCTTPKQLVAVLSLARALLAPDTGPVHLARAVNVPVVGLYAVAPSQLSGPYQAGTWLIDRYPEALWRWRKRRPEEVPWGRRVHTPAAMQLISGDDVLAKLSELF